MSLSYQCEFKFTSRVAEIKLKYMYNKDKLQKKDEIVSYNFVIRV